jgi:hypothetical protein
MLPLQALEEARELIGCGWCQGVEARDREGHRVEPWDARAHAWSLPGALLAVAERTGVDSRFLAQVGLSALALAIVGRVGELQEWNDARAYGRRGALRLRGCVRDAAAPDQPSSRGAASACRQHGAFARGDAWPRGGPLPSRSLPARLDGRAIVRPAAESSRGCR